MSLSPQLRKANAAESLARSADIIRFCEHQNRSDNAKICDSCINQLAETSGQLENELRSPCSLVTSIVEVHSAFCEITEREMEEYLPLLLRSAVRVVNLYRVRFKAKQADAAKKYPEKY